jgi:hypothetical protein
VANCLSFQQYQALSALKTQNELFGGWIYWGRAVDSRAMHQLIQREMVARRYTEDGLAQLAITIQGVAELKRAVVVFNGGQVARPVEVKP